MAGDPGPAWLLALFSAPAAPEPAAPAAVPLVACGNSDLVGGGLVRYRWPCGHTVTVEHGADPYSDGSRPPGPVNLPACERCAAVEPAALVEPVPAAPAAPADSRRYFYRCRGCLDVCTSAEELPLAYRVTVAVCGTCGEHLEYLGRAERERLVKDGVRCACDDRCTSARGPLCSCSCGGRNHGAGMLAVVRYSVDLGAVPVLVMPSPARAARLLADWVTFRDGRAVLQVELGALLDRRAAGEFLPRADFERLLRLQVINRKLGGYSSHAGRMRALASVINQA